MTIDTICDVYRSCGTITGTAAVLGISQPTVRKALITRGLYANATSIAVSELIERGKSDAEIAEILNISVSTANTYRAYTKGTYLVSDDERSKNAKRIRKFRERLKGERP